MIKVEHLSKNYHHKVAVDDVSFTVETGKVTGFLGPNGAGKSTTIKMMLELAGGHGRTTYDGKPLKAYARPSQVVGLLLEAKAFHPTRTARRHLEVLATAGAVPRSRVDEVLETVGLTSEAKKKPGKFSLGMSQRLGIAAALLGQPKYLILDEPANGLDPEGMAWLRNFLKDYSKAGNGVFVSSHLLSEISQMADNVVVIGKGKLMADSSVKKLIAGSSASQVFVRSSDLLKLKKLLKDHKLDFTTHNGGVAVEKTTTDAIGKLLFKANVPILELSQSEASLEAAFLELTASAQEYQAQPAEESKKWYRR